MPVVPNGRKIIQELYRIRTPASASSAVADPLPQVGEPVRSPCHRRSALRACQWPSQTLISARFRLLLMVFLSWTDNANVGRTP